MKLNDRITIKLPVYGAVTIAVVLMLAVLGYALTRTKVEIGAADYRRYEAVAADNDFLKGPIMSALSDDGVITTDEASDLDAQIKIMAQGSYQVTGDARVELEREIAKTPTPTG